MCYTIVILSTTAPLEHIDNQFAAKADNDFEIVNQNLTTQVASVTTREIQQIDSPFNDIKTVIDVPEAYRIDTKPYTERPFFAGEVVFPTSAARYTFLNTSIKFLPGDVIRSNASLLSAMKIASYYRSDLVLNISMAGTISHAGCILVGVLPPFPSYPTTGTPHPRLINTIMSGPHAFFKCK